jgi:hypothetical protein
MTDFSRVFTLLVDDRPMLSFEASTTKQAMEIRKEPWLLDDLTSQTSNGIPLCSATSKLIGQARQCRRANHVQSGGKGGEAFRRHAPCLFGRIGWRRPAERRSENEVEISRPRCHANRSKERISAAPVTALLAFSILDYLCMGLKVMR